MKAMDITQILFTAAITVTTVILTIIGVQLITVLREVRLFLGRMNAIAEELEKIGTHFGQGYTDILGFFSGAKSVFHVLNLITKKKHKK